MSCERYEDDIHRLIDGSLDPAARRDLEGHLRTCDACAEMTDDLRRVRALAGSLERLQPPVRAWNRIAQQTVTPLRGRLLWMARARRAAMPLATAACLALAVGLVYMVKRPAPAGNRKHPAGADGGGRDGGGSHGGSREPCSAGGLRRSRTSPGCAALRKRDSRPRDAREGSAGRGSADRRHPAEEPAAD